MSDLNLSSMNYDMFSGINTIILLSNVYFKTIKIENVMR